LRRPPGSAIHAQHRRVSPCDAGPHTLMPSGRRAVMTTWSEHTIWWQLHPISFTGAEPAALPAGAPAAHRLGRIEAWLDYLVELGCNGLALGPIFASESHGYDTVDHFRIDPRLGSSADFDHLVRACRERGIRLLLDGVFNHVGRGFPAFQDVLARGAASSYASWFRLDFEAGGPDGFGYADFEGHRGLVALNHGEPAVQDYVAGVLAYRHRPGAPRSPAGVDRRRADPRRFRRGDPRGRPGQRDPVRAVEGHLELPERRQLLRAGLGAGPARQLRGGVPAADVRRLPRCHPAGQQAGGPAPLRPRPGDPADRGGHAEHLRGRRAGLPRRQVRARWRRRRDPAR